MLKAAQCFSVESEVIPFYIQIRISRDVLVLSTIVTRMNVTVIHNVNVNLRELKS